MAGTKAAGYKLATYQSTDGPRAGVVVDDKVFDAAKLTGKAAYASVIGILEDWKAAEGTLKAAAAKAAKSRVQGRPLKGTKLLGRPRCCGPPPSTAPAPTIRITWRR